jgi:hypothetical protein
MLLKMGRTAESRRLILAEAAAFGSGAYNGVRRSSRDVQAPMIRFLRESADAYDGKISMARVAMPFFPMRDFYHGEGAGPRHTATVRRIFHRLAELQVPCDLFSETGLDADVLATYDALIVPELRYLSDEHLAAIRSFVDAGGLLIAVGPFATHDELMRERDEPAWLEQGGVVHRELLPTQTEMLELLAPLGETRLVVEEGRDVHPLMRSFCYSDDGEVVVHLLNYSVPIEVGPGETVPRERVRVRAPLPEGAEVAGVQCIAPEMDGFEPELEVRDGACWFTVPEVPIYVVCRVRLR